MSIDVNFIPLSFINDDEEILTQIKNSILFSYLLNNYEETTLDHYLESTQYGYTASALDSGNHRFVRITDIRGGAVDWDSVPFCNCENDVKYLLSENDILVARTGGTTGKSFLVSDPPSNAVFASYLIRLRLKDGVETEFINSFLNSYIFWSQIVEMKSGSAMPNVNAEKLKTLRLPKCSSEVQRSILNASKIRKLDSEFGDLYRKTEGIETFFTDKNLLATELTHQLDLVKQLRQAFLREAMQGQLLPQGATDGPARDLLARIQAEKARLVKEKKIKKSKPLPPIDEEGIPFDIPENWVWCRLGEVCERIHYGFNASAKTEQNRVRLLRITDIQNNKVNWKTVPGCEYTESDLENFLLHENDIVIARTGGTIGKTFLIKDIPIKSLFASYLIRAIPCKKIVPEFVKYFMECPIYWLQLSDAAWGAGQPNVNATALSKLYFPLPPLAEQRRIVARLDKLMESCDALEGSIGGSQRHNEQLLQQVLREALEPEEVV